MPQTFHPVHRPPRFHLPLSQAKKEEFSWVFPRDERWQIVAVGRSSHVKDSEKTRIDRKVIKDKTEKRVSEPDVKGLWHQWSLDHHVMDAQSLFVDWISERAGHWICPGCSSGADGHPLLPVLQLTYLPPPWGECRSSEMGLDFFPVYSITACRIDCETRYIVENCNCRMVHMPGQWQGRATAGRQDCLWPTVHSSPW